MSYQFEVAIDMGEASPPPPVVYGDLAAAVAAWMQAVAAGAEYAVLEATMIRAQEHQDVPVTGGQL